jgi:hypothetical protein
METLQVIDGCEEVRVEISGALSGKLVEQLHDAWKAAQSSQFWRRFVVDISSLAGYDTEGHKLLHLLHRHGAVFAAGTPRSLDYLEEITSGDLRRTLLLPARKPMDRSLSSRSRHRAGVGIHEATVRTR